MFYVSHMVTKGKIYSRVTKHTHRKRETEKITMENHHFTEVDRNRGKRNDRDTK